MTILPRVLVNDCDHEGKRRDENPTIGLLLCKSAKKTVGGLTLPNVRQHHAEEPERSEAISDLPALEGTAETEA